MGPCAADLVLQTLDGIFVVLGFGFRGLGFVAFRVSGLGYFVSSPESPQAWSPSFGFTLGSY